MKLVLPSELVKRLRRELKRAKHREIGGVLVGEHLGNETFRIADISVQRMGGSRAHFTRDVAQNRTFLDNFFASTGRDYQRFNYLGEWHSHPGFSPTPSAQDIATMHNIVQDHQVGVNFAVLLIFSECSRSRLEFSANVFQPHTFFAAELELEQSANTNKGWLKRVIGHFRR